ncbi:MAG: SAM-dependent methyltransferase [Verrucomicrobia bacterium]|nr:SAM-dependent methyltransferase [Verrucomicrobiota bacterium]
MEPILLDAKDREMFDPFNSSMSPLQSLIHSEIHERKLMSFARFMELALYHPEWGYYAKKDAIQNIGRGGDFFTSAAVGPLFGRLLARQFADWWNEMERPNPFHIIECGGLDGRLAADVLAFLQQDSPSCHEAVRYVLAEPLPRLARSQKETLSHCSRVEWTPSVANVQMDAGVIFGNELLDAFPVHSLEWRQAMWRERCVTFSGENLTWTLQDCPGPLRAGLPEDYMGRVEVSPSVARWLETAVHALHRGRILLLDYGWTDEEYFQATRPEGTIRAYHRHQRMDDVLANPGEQDLTAHVRWTPLIRAAKHLGLCVTEFIQQGRWLTRILARQPWPLAPAEVRQFHTLTHPEMMGTPFRALVLSKEISRKIQQAGVLPGAQPMGRIHRNEGL